MGWSQGKGLGANLDGITEHIKVSYKNDSKGMGYKEKEQWTEHDEKFNEFLKNLNCADGAAIDGSNRMSLEEKSQKSKVRVHYRKFTRGKDLSRYSDKDLANIFGKKNLKRDNSIKDVEETTNKYKENEDNTADSDLNFGVQTVKGGSMLDYFKNKLPFGKMQNGYAIGNNGVLKVASNYESEMESPSFSQNEGEGEISEKCKSKRKKIKQIVITEDFELGIENPEFNPKDEEEPIQESCLYEVKRKKSKKIFLENLKAEDEEKKDNLNPYEIIVKKKKKRKLEDNSSGDNPNFVFGDEITNEINGEEYEVKRKKKKQKVSENGLDNPCLNLNDDSKEDTKNEDAEDACDLMLNVAVIPINKTANGLLKQEKEEKNRKRRRKSVRFSEINEEHIIPNDYDLNAAIADDVEKRNELFEINTQVIEHSLQEEKKKDVCDEKEGFVNGGFDIKSIDRMSFYEKEFEKKKKMKNKRIEKGLSNVVFDKHGNALEENIEVITKTIENYQAEVENDINEDKIKNKKLKIGSVGIISDINYHEKTPDGVRLAFKKANFKKVQQWKNEVYTTSSKKSYSHLIVGDVIVGFKNSNLHQIEGYANSK